MTLSEEIINKLYSKRSVLIGRSENESQNDIVVHDLTVSRTIANSKFHRITK